MFETVPHVLPLSSTLLINFYVNYSFFMSSLTPSKENKDYTSCGKHRFIDQTHLCLCVNAICRSVHKCVCVKCECVKHWRAVKVCAHVSVSMFANFICDCLKHNVSVQVC